MVSLDVKGSILRVIDLL